MADLLTNAFFIILTALIYLYLAFFTLINLSHAARSFYIKITGKLSSLVNKNQNIVKIIVFFKSKILFFIGKALRIMFNLLLAVSYNIFNFDSLLIKNDSVLISEPVNITSLALRKLYTENIQAIIVFTCLAIVIFYFILSVF
ncbi:MAG: hypothetical protein L0Y79_06295 [Chlorobi bacterium]|nr:hypothetical protein [Chlorobiota bacterium]